MQADLYGNQISPGDHVAYNWSGRVVRGRVLRVTRSAITIQPYLPSNYYRQKNPSRVKDGASVLVLEKGRTRSIGMSPR